MVLGGRGVSRKGHVDKGMGWLLPKDRVGLVFDMPTD